MSVMGSNNRGGGKMGTPFFNEFKKQASFFFKEKIKTARLALTDVTPAELLTEEATNGNLWVPDTRTLKLISKAAFEVDDYWRIVEILHKRLGRFERENWRLSYNSVILLEHLLTHGPESVAEEFQSDKDVIKQMETFQHIDEKGFNWGLNVRKKSERIMKLLEKGPLLREERDRARKLTRGIQGFGSFTNRTSSASQGILQESSSRTTYGRCNSQFNDHGYNEEDQFQNSNHGGGLTEIDFKQSQSFKKIADCSKEMENPGVIDGKMKPEEKENMAPEKEETVMVDLQTESNPLLGRQEGDGVDEDHPFFDDIENLTSSSSSLLPSSTNRTLQAC